MAHEKKNFSFWDFGCDKFSMREKKTVCSIIGLVFIDKDKKEMFRCSENVLFHNFLSTEGIPTVMAVVTSKMDSNN